MGWSRRQNPADDDTTQQDDPLADNMRFERTQPPGEPPPEDQGGASIYDQQTVVDQNFASRAQARRERQTDGLNVQRVTSWAADPRNSRKLVIWGAVLLSLILLLAVWRISRNWTAADLPSADDLNTASDPAFASVEAPAFVDPAAASALPSAGASFPAVQVPAENVPGTDPAQQSPAAAQAFVVTGTGTEGLFLRPDPSQNNTPLATIPDGTRVEGTGNTQNDGTREWREIRTDAGTGWVATEFLQPAP